jgi:3-isopropylmalate dehydrogenase
MHKIVVIPGDGIGVEVMSQGTKILKVMGEKYDINFQLEEARMGGTAFDELGTCLPESTVGLCEESDAILFGAAGGPKWDVLPSEKRPERALAVLRKQLELFVNLRPVRARKSMIGALPVKPEIVGEGLDIVMVRELTGGIYYGLPKEGNSERAVDSMVYTAGEVERIARVAFDLARKRSRILASIDKENMMEASKLWRAVVIKVAKDYPDVELRHVLVDNCAFQIVAAPQQFDVMLAGNMFGDILSDELGALAGSLGMCPSASLGYGKLGLYEPIHGTAPDIAGKGIANPIGMILSVAMMLRYSFDMEGAAEDVEKAVDAVLDKGYRTADIAEEKGTVGTEEMGDLIAQEVYSALAN